MKALKIISISVSLLFVALQLGLFVASGDGQYLMNAIGFGSGLAIGWGLSIEEIKRGRED